MTRITSGYNQEKIQDMNRELVLNLLRKEGECSRVHLAKMTQLKQATITHIINDFITWGVVKETGFLTGDKGRRSIGISLNNDGYGVLGIRIARKNYSVGLFDLSGTCIHQKRVNIKMSQSPETTMKLVLHDSKALLADSGDRIILAAGVAIPGPYSIKKGRIELMTGVQGWNNISIKNDLEEALNIPVFVEQNANAGALAQYWHNDEQYRNEMLVYIAIGQGVGAGIINNGDLIRGAAGMAGEIGHTSINFSGPKCVCGNHGCLENYCSSIAFTNEVNRKKGPGSNLSFQEAQDLVRKKDPVAAEVFLESCDHLSVGIINIINSFNPTYVVLGDDMAHIMPNLMLERVTENIKNRLISGIYEDTRICMSLVDSDSMLHGAAVVAIREILARPAKYFTSHVRIS